MALIVDTTQKKLRRCVLSVSEIIGDQRADYTADGDIYSAEMIVRAVNKSIETKYNASLAQLIKPGMENESYREFLKLNVRYQEFRQLQIVDFLPDSKAIPKSDDIKKIVGIRLNCSTPTIISTCGELTADKYDKALGDPNSNYLPDLDNPWFFEQKDTVRIEIGNIANGHTSKIRNGTIDLTVLVTPIYTVIDTAGPDINISWTWVSDVSEKAAELILSNQQF